MKRINCKVQVFIQLSSLFILFVYVCSAQGIANTTNVWLASEEFHPVIRGRTPLGDVVARQITRKEGTDKRPQFVVVDKSSGEAISAFSTNDVCHFNGKLFTVDPAGPSHAAFINISQPFGTNEFSASQAESFMRRIGADYFNFDSPHRKLIHLESVLKSEDTSRSAWGTPLNHVELNVESGKLVLLFESFTHIKGKVTLDDQLNPSSVTITAKPPVR